MSDRPRIGLFLFDVAAPDAVAGDRLRETLDRIPAEAAEALEAIVVMEDRVGGRTEAPLALDLGARKLEVLVHRAPRDLGYGGVRKAALEYALLRGFDVVVFLRAGIHPPEALPALIAPHLEGTKEAVWASRLVDHVATRRAGMSFVRLLAHRLTTALQNTILGLRLSDYHSSFRALPMHAMRRLPFQLNADDRTFDMQLAIQCRALGLPVREVQVPPDWKEYGGGSDGLRGILRGSATAIDYRIHQLHGQRRGRYFVDRGVHYTLKQSPTGSHMQIVDRIRPNSRVLDLGCSQGLLARPLREKGVVVTGVDAEPGDDLAEELREYFRRDLEESLELPTGRVYDYVVSSDVIEHLRNRRQLLRSARRFLKPDGRLIVSTPNIAIWVYRLSLLLGRFEYGPKGVLDETHVHLFTRATFRRELERAGFHIVREMATALPFEVVFESTGRSRLVRAMASSYHLLTRLWPTLFAYQFILEAEITTLDDESTAGHPDA